MSPNTHNSFTAAWLIILATTLLVNHWFGGLGVEAAGTYNRNDKKEKNQFFNQDDGCKNACYPTGSGKCDLQTHRCYCPPKKSESDNDEKEMNQLYTRADDRYSLGLGKCYLRAGTCICSAKD